RNLDNRLSGPRVELKPRSAASPRETLSQLGQLGGCAGGARVAASHVLGRNDAYDKQLGRVPAGHLGCPLDRLGRGVRSIGRDQNSLHQRQPPFTLAEPQIYATPVEEKSRFAVQDHEVGGVLRGRTVRPEDRRRYPMSRAEAWGLLADTDHLNRSIGLPPVEF